MKKNMKNLIVSVASFLLAFSAIGFAGCKEPDSGSTPPDSSSQQEATFTVTFNANGGSAVQSVTVKAGQSIDLSAYTTTLEGNYFYGWSLDAAFTTRANKIFTVESDVTLYAEWGTEEKYLLNFETNGGTKIESVLYRPNDYMAEPETPTKANYVFGGWYKDEALTKEFSFLGAPQMPKKEMTIYAKWNPVNAIVFNTNGGNAMETIYGEVGDPIVGLEEPVRDGYIFDGWYSDKACTKPYDVVMISSGMVNVYAKWHEQAKNVQLTLNVNFGELTGRSLATGNEGEAMDETDAVTAFTKAVNDLLKSSYLGNINDVDDTPIMKLSGWSYDPEGHNRLDGSFPAEDAQIYAVWTRTAAYCEISFTETNDAFYVKKDTQVSVDVLNAQMQAAKDEYENRGCKVDGFYTAGGNRLVEGDKVTMDMALTPYVYSPDLVYEYTTVQTSGVITKGYALKGYDAQKKAEYLAKDNLLLLIPEYVDGAHGRLPIIEIADEAFKGYNVSDVNMPKSVMKIGARAFQCSKLTEISIPAKVFALGDNVFEGSTLLESVTFGGKISQLGATVFSGTPYEEWMAENSTDKSGNFIMFDEIIYSYIGNGETAVTPSIARTIGGGAFKNNATVKTLTISDSIRYISDYAFEGSALENVTVGKYFADMGVGIFKNCKSLVSVNFTAKYNIAQFGESMFEGCSSLTTVNISELTSLKKIGARAFFGCISFKALQVTNNFQEIGESAFEGCTSLETVDFGTDENSLFNLIGSRAFAGCTSLKRVIIRGNLIKNEYGVEQIVTFKAGVFAAAAGTKVAPILYVRDVYTDNWSEDEEHKTDSYVTIYKNRLPAEYKNMDIRPIDSQAPNVTVEVSDMEANASVDLLAYLLANGVSVTDDDSDSGKCILTIKVVFDDATNAIVEGVDGKYNMSKKGDYTVILLAEDEFGNVSETQISLTVI